RSSDAERAGRRCTGADPHRDADGTRAGQADDEADRARGGSAGVLPERAAAGVKPDYCSQYCAPLARPERSTYTAKMLEPGGIGRAIREILSSEPICPNIPQ